MKSNFTTYDVVCMVAELQKLIGMRVNQIYDIDNKTYLIRLQQNEQKSVILIESGCRFHVTGFEWPKSVTPSSFTIKLRKHLKNKRLERLEQLGVDRVVDMQFGINEAAYHIILELYDRGNVILTDHEMTILNVLRPHAAGEEVRFNVREKYPLQMIKQQTDPLSEEDLRKLIENSRPGEKLQSILTQNLNCGPVVVRHVLLKHGLGNQQIPGDTNANNDDETGGGNKKGGKGKKKNRNQDGSSDAGVDFNFERDFNGLVQAIHEVDEIMAEAKIKSPKGFIVQKTEPKLGANGEEEIFYRNVEYHPLVFMQNEGRPHKEFESFMLAVDEYYSMQEGQKIDLKAIQQEREALKKLSNVKHDHAKRLEDLTKAQRVDAKRAELITRNQELVDKAILAVRSAIANQMAWPDIQDLVKAAQANHDPVASSIRQLKLEINHISIFLKDPYEVDDNADEDANDDEDDNSLPPMVIDVDLGLSAYANARKYHDQRRTAAKKEQKTIESSGKALKSAEKRTQQALKEVKTMTSIQKARKVYWFEKFYWFISSENYLVIAGRDQQQNELIVKRYMRATDIYCHADIQGAASVIIRNPTGDEIPPKTLLEAGAMAISYSIAWDAKVVTSAYWVKSDQVSKTAPTGEYLGTGSFMIRGKKNFLPPCHLILGLSFLFKLEESSIERHKGERRVRNFNEDDDTESKLGQLRIENEKLESVREEEEHQDIELGSSDSEEDEPEADDETKSEKNTEENAGNDGEEASEDDDDSSAFPDTEIKIEHDTGKVTVKADPRLNSASEDNENVIYLGDDKPYIIQALPPRQKQQTKAKQNQQKLENSRKGQQQQQQHDKELSSQNKRGQRGKMKKMKEKYRDQDEDERKLRMEILKSSGDGKSTGKKGKKNSVVEEKAKKIPGKKFEPKPVEDGDDTEEVPANADVDMLDSLTGFPHDEDELLFAIPVVAPYQTLQSYKFKVKITPGTHRRGKAAKMAVQIFLKDKSCTQREKDLIKNIKEDTLARNIPGKVKLSAPQIQKIYK